MVKTKIKNDRVIAKTGDLSKRSIVFCTKSILILVYFLNIAKTKKKHKTYQIKELIKNKCSKNAKIIIEDLTHHHYWIVHSLNNNLKV